MEGTIVEEAAGSLYEQSRDQIRVYLWMTLEALSEERAVRVEKSRATSTTAETSGWDGIAP